MLQLVDRHGNGVRPEVDILLVPVPRFNPRSNLMIVLHTFLDQQAEQTRGEAQKLIDGMILTKVALWSELSHHFSVLCHSLLRDFVGVTQITFGRLRSRQQRKEIIPTLEELNHIITNLVNNAVSERNSQCRTAGS